MHMGLYNSQCRCVVGQRNLLHEERSNYIDRPKGNQLCATKTDNETLHVLHGGFPRAEGFNSVQRHSAVAGSAIAKGAASGFGHIRFNQRAVYAQLDAFGCGSAPATRAKA